MSTIVDLLRSRADERPDVLAYRFLRDGEGSEDTRTWGQLDRRARAIGTTLRGMGAGGTNVLLLYPPGLDFIEGYFGCLYAGATPVPAYPPEPARLARTLPRVQAIVADAQARFALTTRPLLALADMVFAQAPDLRSLEWLATDGVDIAAAEAWARPPIGGDTLAMLQYTSGSTGTPKGVMLSHGNLLANAQCVFSAFEFTPDDRILSWLPVFHDMGFMSGVLQPLYSGCDVVGLPPTAFLEKPYRWLAAIHTWRATVSGGPNFAYDLCVRKTTPEQRSALDLSCWKLAYNGAETIRIDTLDRFASTFEPSGFQRRAIFPCYGLAEATLIVSGSDRAALPIAHRFDKHALDAGAVRHAADGASLVASGRAVAGQTIAIVDPETGRRAAPDRVGEIWVAGASVGLGYWRRADDTAATFGQRLAGDPTSTYVRTGDLGFVYEQQLYVCGRAKDLIIVRGANHYPQDVELTVERAHPAIRPGCVAAFSVELDGEERVVVVAEVDRRYHDRDRRRHTRTEPDRRSGEPSRRESEERAPNDQPLDVDQLFWDLRDAIGVQHELEPYAIVLIRAGSIHKTSSGKLQRRACKAAFAKGELEVLADWRHDGTKRHSDVPSTKRERNRTPSSQPLRPTSVVPPKLAVGIAALRKPSVLVTDADPAHREAVARALGEQLAIAVAETADQAAALAAATTFAAVVSDDLALLARIADVKPETTRLLVTRFDDPDAVREAVASGAVAGVLARNAGAQQLQAAVGEAVDAWVVHHTDLAIAAIETWLAAWLGERLGVNAKTIDLEAPASAYGLDSLSLVELQTALAEWLGHEVPDTIMRGRSSLRSVARRLASAGERRHTAPATTEDATIAIVGMSCTVPGARDVDTLWRLVHDATDPIAEVPEDRLRGSTATRWGGAIDGLTEFDAAFFGLAPRDAAHVDPQHRLLLETTWKALEDAGTNPQELAGSDTGVFVGISGSDYVRAQPELAIIDTSAAAAQRLSYFYNLRGPSMAIDAGDASSMSALHLAVASLARGECRVAIVAGVNLVLTPQIPGAYAKAGLLASDGRCKPLDQHGDGTVLSDGCGVLVLKRASDARTGGNRVRAHVLATAVRQNGRGHGLTAPNEAAQEQVIREAMQRANVPATQVQYVELNARGIAAHDGIEVRALATVIGGERSEPCVLGSLKAKIGDTRAASGVLGVIEAVLVLEHDRIPPLFHHGETHADIALGTDLVVPTAARAWSDDTRRRVACVNSFGLLGTNGVAIVAREQPAPAAARPAPPAQLLCVSARSQEALRGLADRYATWLATMPQEELADACYTANLGRAHFAHRAAVTATTPEAASRALRAIAAGEVVTKPAGRGAARIAFVLSGGGARPGVARELYELEGRFRTVVQRGDQVVRGVLGRSLVAALYEGAGWDAVLDDPATVTIEYALAELWQCWGVYPDLVMGRDVGEYAAAAVANALPFEDAVMLACERARRLRELAPVASVLVTAAEDELAPMLEALALPLAIAERRSRQLEVVGVPAAVQELVRRLAAEGIATTATRATALHTPLVEPILDGLAEAAGRAQLRAPSVPLISNVTGKRYTAMMDAAYWRRHTLECVQLERGFRELVREGTDLFLEIGPGSELASGDMPTSATWLVSLDPDRGGDWERMLWSLGALYERGLQPSWTGFYQGQDRRRIAAPTYPFERKRCWPDTSG